jgi:hypothetical protein
MEKPLGPWVAIAGDPKAWTRCGYQDGELGSLDNILPATKEIGTQEYYKNTKMYISKSFLF